LIKQIAHQEHSFRGLGIDKGLEILAKVKKQIGVPVLTDVHDIAEIAPVCSGGRCFTNARISLSDRQTSYAHVLESGKPVNFKKGQFLSPLEMLNVIEKARASAVEQNLPDQFMVCERGASFGYNNLVSDMRSLAILRDSKAPVVFDATHSVQLAWRPR
jgi:2-dehydro-3-deoxyphosphooctonate aldolase (KDO 8-P synthase)